MTPTPLPRDGGNTLRRVDDASSEIQYSGQWTAGTVNTTSTDQATVHTSTQSGSIVKFSFTGSFIAVYGILDGDPYAASFAVDGGAPSAEGIAEPPASPKPDWPFFSRLLGPGPHELEVTVDSGTLNLDYIEYTSDDTADASRDPAYPSSQQSAAAASASSTALSFSRTKLSKGAVAGISIAGAVLVILLVFMVYFVLFRRTRRVRHRSVTPEKPLELIPESQPKPPLRRHFRLGSIYRPTPARSAQSSKTATSSAPTSVTQSSAMFTSVIMLSPALSMVSEESDRQQQV